MNVFIPNDLHFPVSSKELFILTRPFKTSLGWGNDDAILKRWELGDKDILYTPDPESATLLLLPYSINTCYQTGNLNAVEQYDKLCAANGIRGYAYISGDFGIQFPEFENITYFRMGGFRSQLSKQNQGFPVPLSDQLNRIYGIGSIRLREWSVKPVIGFCGHASDSLSKKVKEQVKFIRENFLRLIKNPLRRDWEPLFPSAWHRYQLLKLLERSDFLSSNFIYRDHYRGGATTETTREQSTREYYDNIQNSDYVLCVRGGGNFSVRLYETLMMGRIPVFINTDCLLPFADKINWREHVVWVEWNDRFDVADMISNFHKSLTPGEFVALQQRNRTLWQKKLSVGGMLTLLS